MPWPVSGAPLKSPPDIITHGKEFNSLNGKLEFMWRLNGTGDNIGVYSWNLKKCLKLQ